MVGIIMGSDSDLPIMQEAIDILEGFDIQIEVDIVSAHRTPEKLFEYSKNAHLLQVQAELLIYQEWWQA
jgi:5-(carboxyamino)imidazole ribonucleotide mutase